MAKSVKYSIGAVTAEGRTKTEARERCEAKAADILNDIECHGAAMFRAPPCQTKIVAIMVARSTSSWEYRFLKSDGDFVHEAYGVISDRETALCEAMHHAAQYTLGEFRGWSNDKPYLDSLQEWAESILGEQSQPAVLRKDWEQALVEERLYGNTDAEAHDAMLA